MKEKSKNLGTKHCPNPLCRKVIMKTQDLRGEGPMEQRCPHCGCNYKAMLIIKTIIEITLLSILFVTCSLVWIQHEKAAIAEKKNCRALGQETAQKLLEIDKNIFKSLDRNHDGIACEEFINASE